jgi:hypothetical protein
MVVSALSLTKCVPSGAAAICPVDIAERNTFCHADQVTVNASGMQSAVASATSKDERDVSVSGTCSTCGDAAADTLYTILYTMSLFAPSSAEADDSYDVLKGTVDDTGAIGPFTVVDIDGSDSADRVLACLCTLAVAALLSLHF